MGIFFWVMFGILTGITFNRLLKHPELSLGKSGFYGLIGGLTLGWIATLTMKWPTLIGLNLASFLVPVIGSFITVWTLNDLSSAQPKLLSFRKSFAVTDLKEQLLDTASTLVAKTKIREQ